MTVKQIAAIETHIGLSSDTKPSSPPVGSTFFETDTGDTYVFNSAWTRMPAGLGWRIARKTIAFTGAAGLGAVGTVSFFTTTGAVLVRLIGGYCSEDLASAGGGSLALGVVGSTSTFIAATLATDIDNGELWTDTAPSVAEAAPAATVEKLIAANIIGTVTTGDITDGTIEVAALWAPFSSNGSLVPA